MLGRTELLEDMHIVGKFNIDQIKCDPAALAESRRLDQIFNDSEDKQKEKRAGAWKKFLPQCALNEISSWS